MFLSAGLALLLLVATPTAAVTFTGEHGHPFLQTDAGMMQCAIEDNGNSITVDASALDIRALTNADVVTVEDGGGSITVDASALDIRALTNADVVTVEDGGGSITVDASALDIRALTSSDTVTIVDGGGSITVDGSLTYSLAKSDYTEWHNDGGIPLASAVLVGGTAQYLDLTDRDGTDTEATGIDTRSYTRCTFMGYNDADADDVATLKLYTYKNANFIEANARPIYTQVEVPLPGGEDFYFDYPVDGNYYNFHVTPSGAGGAPSIYVAYACSG